MTSSMEKLNGTLQALRSLRYNVRKLFEHLSGGADQEDENGRENFIKEVSDNIATVNRNARELEQYVSSLQVPPAPYSLGNTTYLAQEITPEKHSLYTQLVHSYKWIDKVHDHSFLAFNNLNQNNLRRSYTYCSQKRGRIPFSSCNNPDPEHTDKLFSEINHVNTTYKVCRPFGTNAVVMVNLCRVLKAAIVCKGVLIEWVAIRGYDEPLEPEDLWLESRYEVFRKVQDHTHSAMLHFFSPTLPDLAIKSYMTWLNSYSKLFMEPCKRCGRFISERLPPTWRDLRTLEPFHEECRNC